MSTSSKFSIIFFSLILTTFCFTFFPINQPPTLTQKCLNVLPYGTNNINHNAYYSWYSKLGENINGTTYEPGHVFQRHIAINHACTDQQKKEKKTVFYDESEFYKALNRDDTNCTMDSEKAFNWYQTKSIASASNYIRGIDCSTGTEHYFGQYFVEYKRTIQNAHPTQAQYMGSQKATVHTFYPKR